VGHILQGRAAEVSAARGVLDSATALAAAPKGIRVGVPRGIQVAVLGRSQVSVPGADTAGRARR
jgi:hypothetical protein